MGTNKPIVMERPQRGREMVSKQIAGQEKGKTTLMHEGYVGGAKYLVPDEDLEVMKELVDFKLGKKPMDRYVRDYDYPHSQEPDEKFRKMSQRLQAMDSLSDESDVTELEEEKPKDRKIRFEDSVEESPEPAVEESESEEPSSEATEETQESISSGTSTSTAKTLPFEVRPTDGHRLRFLLSGHIRNNLKPVFIFHEYDGRSPIGVTTDFSSSQREGAVDLFISGKFYLESILEEVDNKPVSLNIKPDQILIDERSKVYEEQFYELLSVGEVNIDFVGKFIKQMDTKKYTPFLTFNVQNYPDEREHTKSKVRSKKPAAVVYVAQPSSNKVFEQRQAGDKATRHMSKKPWRRGRDVEAVVLVAQPSSHNVFEQRQAGDKARQVGENTSKQKQESVEPHLQRNPSKRPVRRGRDAGDVGSEGGLVYNCDVNRRWSSKDKNIFRRLSHMFFSRN